MATVKKYNVPRDNAMADALDRQDGYGKYAPKKNDAIINKPMKFGGKMKKAENGKSFPDLNKDGKITKADILKGRGVIAKNGMKMGGKLAPNKSNVSKYVSNLNKAKGGAKMKRGC
jgi:hypothetical protein